MVDVGRMEHDLRDLFLNNEYQFWAGDFNSLTRRDYSEADWEAVALARSEDNWEAPKTEVRIFTHHKLQEGERDLSLLFKIFLNIKNNYQNSMISLSDLFHSQENMHPR